MAQDRPDTSKFSGSLPQTNLNTTWADITERWELVDSLLKRQGVEICIPAEQFGQFSVIQVGMGILTLAPGYVFPDSIVTRDKPACLSWFAGILSTLSGIMMLQSVCDDPVVDKNTALILVELRRDMEELIQPILQEPPPECKDAVNELLQLMGAEPGEDFIKLLRRQMYE